MNDGICWCHLYWRSARMDFTFNWITYFLNFGRYYLTRLDVCSNRGVMYLMYLSAIRCRNGKKISLLLQKWINPVSVRWNMLNLTFLRSMCMHGKIVIQRLTSILLVRTSIMRFTFNLLQLLLITETNKHIARSQLVLNQEAYYINQLMLRWLLNFP